MPINMQSTQEVNLYKRNLEACKANDLPRKASFVTESLGLRMTLMPVLELVDATKPGGIARTPGSGFNIQFKGGIYNTQSSKQVELIMTSAFYEAGKININPEDPGGLWEELGFLKIKTVEVVDKGEQKFIPFKELDLSKVSPPKEDEENKEARMVVG